jgi:hypothetical protein
MLCYQTGKLIAIFNLYRYVVNVMEYWQLEVVMTELLEPVSATCFNNQQLLVLCLCVPYDSRCKQRLFP